MKVNSNRDIPFKCIYTNKGIKKCLEFAADNGALFAASAAVGFSAARPVSIWLTPKTEKEDRQLAVSKSIVSSLIGFLLTLLLSIPLANGIKKIDKNPQKYLNSEIIKKYKNEKDNIYESKSYSLGTQSFKLGLGALTAIPKAYLVALSIPVADKVLSNNKPNKPTDISFKGKQSEFVANNIGKTLNNSRFQKFTQKYKDTNFPMHIIAGTDVISTLAFCYFAKNNKKIQEDRTQTLINNSIIATGLSLLCGYTTDKLLDKPTEKFISKYKKINANDKNLAKQIEGIKIAKPILILGSIYYILIPFISTFFADKTLNKNKKLHIKSQI